MAGVDLYTSHRQSIRLQTFTKCVSGNLPRAINPGRSSSAKTDTRCFSPTDSNRWWHETWTVTVSKTHFRWLAWKSCILLLYKKCPYTCIIVAQYADSRQRTGVRSCASAFIRADLCFCEWHRLKGSPRVSAWEAERLSANEWGCLLPLPAHN